MIICWCQEYSLKVSGKIRKSSFKICAENFQKSVFLICVFGFSSEFPSVFFCFSLLLALLLLTVLGFKFLFLRLLIQLEGKKVEDDH